MTYLGAHSISTKNHVAHAFTYADATARAAATGFLVTDLYKLALQQSDDSLWMLTAYSTPTWKQIDAGGPAVTSVAGRTGAVTLSTADISGLGTAATHAATDFQPAGSYQPSGSYAVTSNNLSDLSSAATARTNLGLGTAATHAATDFQAAGTYVNTFNGRSGAVSLTSSDVTTALGYTPGSGSGTVSSVALTVPGVLFSVSGSPITTGGTLAFALLTQAANTVLAGPTAGAAAAPTMRALVAADIPSLTLSRISDAGTAASHDVPASGNATSSQVVLGSDTRLTVTGITANQTLGQVTGVLDGGGATLTVGSKVRVVCPFAGTITAATTLVDQTGSVSIEVRKCTYAQYDAGATHPVTGDKISASAPATVSSATKANDTSLVGWSTSVSAGDIIEMYLSSVTACQWASCTLSITKS